MQLLEKKPNNNSINKILLIIILSIIFNTTIGEQNQIIIS